MSENVEIKISTKGANSSDRELSKVGKSFDRLKGKAKGVGSSINNLKKSFFTLQNAAIVTGGILAAKVGFNLVETGAGIEVQRKAFRNLAISMGADGDTIVKELREVSKETVSTTELIGSASRAMLLGIQPEKLTKLMEIARAASKATGDTISKSFDDITLGIGRNSKMILDNLGIIIRVDEANQKYAETLGKSSAELTDTEKKQAFLNATLEAGQVIINNVGKDSLSARDKLERFKVKITETKEQMALFAATVFEDVEPALTKLISKLTTSTATIRNGIPVYKEYTLNIKALLLPASQWGNILIRNNEKTEEATDKQDKHTAAIKKAEIAQNKLNDAFTAKMKALGVQSEGAAQEQGDDAFKKINEAAKKRNQLEREGLAITKEVRTSQEVLNDRLAKLDDLWNKGVISQETYDRAVEISIEREKRGQAQIAEAIERKNEANMTSLEFHGRNAISRLDGAFTNFFLNMNQGWSNVKSFAVNVIGTIKQKLAEMAASKAISMLTNLVFPGAGGGGGGILSGIGKFFGFHKGGVVGSGGQPTRQLSFAGMPRMHGGGLAGDEVPAVLQTNEGVLSRKGMANLDKLNLGNSGAAGGGSGGSITVLAPVTLNAIDVQSGIAFLSKPENLEVFEGFLRQAMVNGAAKHMGL